MNASIDYRLGYSAYPSRLCPYPILSRESATWWAGWEAARGDDRGERARHRGPLMPTSDATIALALRDRRAANE